MSTNKREKRRKEQSLWKLMEPILKQHSNGIEMEKLRRQINSNNTSAVFSKDFICSYINDLAHNLKMIAFLSTNPSTVCMRRPQDIHKLRKISEKEYTLYKEIEKAQNNGTLMRYLTQNTGLKNKEIKKCLSKTLIPQHLVIKSQRIRDNQLYYYTTRYPPLKHEKKTVFQKDEHFLKDIFIIIQRQIQKCDQRKGISSHELLSIIEKSGLLNEKNVLSINQIELIIQLLMYENKIWIVPNTVPTKDLNTFLTASKDGFYHLIKAVQNLRNDRMEINGLNTNGLEFTKKRKLNGVCKEEQKLNKKRKLNDTKSVKITLEYENGFEDENENAYVEDMQCYRDIKFKYNNYRYDSHFAEIPCQSCPVSENCCDDGLINPIACPYLNAWLDI